MIDKGTEFLLTNYGGIATVNQSIKSMCWDSNNLIYVGVDVGGNIYKHNILTGINSSFASLTGGVSVNCQVFGALIYAGCEDKVFSIDPTTAAVVDLLTPFVATTKVAACELLGGYLYLCCNVAGGARLVVMDTATNLYTDKGVVSAGEVDIKSIHYYNGNMYIGTGTAGQLGIFDTTLETFTVKTVGGLVTAINSIVDYNGKLYLGCAVSSGDTNLYVYDPVTGLFASLGAVPGVTAVNFVGIYKMNELVMGTNTTAKIFTHNIATGVTALRYTGNTVTGDTDIYCGIDYDNYHYYLGAGARGSLFEFGMGIVIFSATEWPHMSYIRAYKDMMFGIGDFNFPNTVMWTDIGMIYNVVQGTYWPAAYYTMCGADNDKTNSLIVYRDRLMVINQYSTESMTGFTPTTLEHREVNYNIGTDGPRLAVMGQNEFYIIFGGELFFYDTGYTRISDDVIITSPQNLEYYDNKIYIASETSSLVFDIPTHRSKRRAFVNIATKKFFFNMNENLFAMGIVSGIYKLYKRGTTYAPRTLVLSNLILNEHQKTLSSVYINGLYKPNATFLTNATADYTLTLGASAVYDDNYISKRVPPVNKHALDFILTNSDSDNFIIKEIGLLFSMKLRRINT